jgi:hypothetical protein
MIENDEKIGFKKQIQCKKTKQNKEKTFSVIEGREVLCLLSLNPILHMKLLFESLEIKEFNELL